jgi:putative nucleotidyltransferase with HDIG domain
MEDDILLSQLPELNLLKEVIEDNKWHNNQLVYDHTISVFKELQLLLKLNVIDEKEQEEAVSKHLDEKIGNHARRNLLLIAALLHDIGKRNTMKVNPDGSTTFPGHEEKGAGMINSFSRQLGLNPNDIEFVKTLVLLHGETHKAVGSCTKNRKSKLDDIRKKFRGQFLELLLLCWADMLGSHLRFNNPEDFRKRNKTYMSLINDMKLC